MTDAPEDNPPRRRRKRKPSGPSRLDSMKRLARHGDVDGILTMLKDSPVPNGDHGDAMEQIRVALDRLGERDPERLVKLLFSKVLALEGALMLRCQYFIDRAIAESDKKYPGLGDLPEPIAETWIPRLGRLRSGILETGKCLSTITHTFALANQGPIKHREHNQNVIRFSDAAKKLDRNRRREASAGE